MSDLFENGQIVSVRLGHMDAPCLTSWIDIKFAGSGQSFGGYALDDKPNTSMGKRSPCSACGLWVARVMEVVGVDEWSKLVGKNIRVRRDEPRGLIVAIGHIFDDKWFQPKAEFKKLDGGTK